MKHFTYIDDIDANEIFYKKPSEFNRFSDKDTLSYALGATLYMPATKEIVKKIKHKEIRGLTTIVMCFEDSIREENLEEAENNVVNTLQSLGTLLKEGSLSENDIPLFFLRVRNPKQFKEFTKRLSREDFNILTGFIFPKFNSTEGYSYLSLLHNLNVKHGIRIYGMPILESPNLIYRESRDRELVTIKYLLSEYKSYILNIRVGGTDFSSRFGLRRSIDNTIYDIGIISNCLYDILNQFTREEDDYVVSAPVWEYFPSKRFLKPRLRKTPFDLNDLRTYRLKLIDSAIDGLIRETLLDKANGFTGKTIIHPSHITFANALLCVTKEEYLDAKMILENQGGGVLSGTSNNKMNEVNPHTNWAKKIMRKAHIYGVINDGNDCIKLF